MVLQKKSQYTGKVPVLRMVNITREGKVAYSNLVYTSNEKDIKEMKLKYNDILFNRTNRIELVGKTSIFKENFPCIYAGYIISFTPKYINPDFLNYVMNSSYQRDWCNEVKPMELTSQILILKNLRIFMFLFHQYVSSFVL